jgi:cbb3-type cytochrome oxidase maturation protein
MGAVLYLLPLALLLGFVGLLAFMWTLKSGQYEDLDGAAWRAIIDDDDELIPHKRQTAQENDPQESVNKSEDSA